MISEEVFPAVSFGLGLPNAVVSSGVSRNDLSVINAPKVPEIEKLTVPHPKNPDCRYISLYRNMTR